MSPQESRPAATNCETARDISAGGVKSVPIVSQSDSPQDARRFQPMPELTTEQYDALKADISVHGIVIPIVVDQYDRVLDGHNRFRIAAELKIDCPREIHHVVDDDEAADLAVTLNCARRHLTREQVREVIAAEILRRPADSDRGIARRVGCSPSTVGAVRDPQVSKLDTTTMTKDEALQLTAELKKTIREGRLAWQSILIGALSNAIPAADLIAALMARMRADEKGHDETVNSVFRDAFYMPMIDALLDPKTAESWRPEWDHELFLPLAEDERQSLLASISGVL